MNYKTVLYILPIILLLAACGQPTIEIVIPPTEDPTPDNAGPFEDLLWTDILDIDYVAPAAGTSIEAGQCGMLAELEITAIDRDIRVGSHMFTLIRNDVGGSPFSSLLFTVNGNPFEELTETWPDNPTGDDYRFDFEVTVPMGVTRTMAYEVCVSAEVDVVESGQVSAFFEIGRWNVFDGSGRYISLGNSAMSGHDVTITVPPPEQPECNEETRLELSGYGSSYLGVPYDQTEAVGPARFRAESFEADVTISQQTVVFEHNFMALPEADDFYMVVENATAGTYEVYEDMTTSEIDGNLYLTNWDIFQVPVGHEVWVTFWIEVEPLTVGDMFNAIYITTALQASDPGGCSLDYPRIQPYQQLSMGQIEIL